MPKIEAEIEEQYNNIKKKFDFINAQLIAVNEEIYNKIDFKSVQYLMNEDYDTIMKKLIDIKTERKTTEENIKKRAEEEKQRALEEMEKRKQLEIEKAKEQAEREVQEKIRREQEQQKEKEETGNTDVPETKSESTDKLEKGTYIYIKVNGLSEEATKDLLEVIKKHNLKYIKKEVI